MTYNKQFWENHPSTITPLSAQRLNHLETQYDEATAYADGVAQLALSESKTYTNQQISNLPDPSAATFLGAGRTPRISSKVKTHLASGSRYVVHTIHTGGVYFPGLVGKAFANDFRGGTGSDLKPVRENLADAESRIGASFISNASGWYVSGNVGEMCGTQIKDGVLLHEATTDDWRRSDSVGFTRAGELRTYSAIEGDTAQDMLDDDIVDSWGFGPTLIKDGVANDLSNPFWSPFVAETSARQIIGEKTNGDLVFITVNGKTGVSGITGHQTVQLAVDEGLYKAFNLDGGGSVQTRIGGVASTASSDNWGRRPVPDFMFLNIPTSSVAQGDMIPLVLESGSTADVESGDPVTPYLSDLGNFVVFGGRVKPSSGAIAAGSGLVFSTLPDWARPKRFDEIFTVMGQNVRVRKLVVRASTGVMSVVAGSEGQDINSASLNTLGWEI